MARSRVVVIGRRDLGIRSSVSNWKSSTLGI
jgi:hypothetical protein